MTEPHTNLTAAQKDYAIFLPALSTFYALFVGRQRRGLIEGTPYIDAGRIPANMPHGVESLNWLAPEGNFQYHWSLHSAGHASLETTKDMFREDMYRDRNHNTSWLLGDSGGFQIGKGKWEGNWKDPACPNAMKKRKGVLEWMDTFMDYGMVLDIPAWVSRIPEGAKASGITTYQEAVDGTRINNDYFVRNRNGNCKFLNVLQGDNFAQADDWYNQMKDYCDPKQYPDAHFNGWAMGGQNMCDIHLALKRVVTLRFDGLLEKGVHDYMHFLGTSKLEWAMVLTAIQRGVRKNHNENFTVTFDCASPFLCTANGQIYTGHRLEHKGKWSYIMDGAADDKALAKDTSPFNDLMKTMYPDFMPTPMTNGLKVNDICHYGPGDLNRMGQSNKTSWDSFSYALLMNHNVYTHINSVQEANKAFDAGDYPYMLVDEQFERVMAKDVIARIFEIDDRDAALKLIDEYEWLWLKIVGTRGMVGKKSINASAQFNTLFG
jgi:hypothetical protein